MCYRSNLTSRRLHHHISVCNAQAINSHCQCTTSGSHRSQNVVTTYCHVLFIICPVTPGMEHIERLALDAHWRPEQTGKLHVLQPDLSNECRDKYHLTVPEFCTSRPVYVTH
jgi:hypothetical protein